MLGDIYFEANTAMHDLVPLNLLGAGQAGYVRQIRLDTSARFWETRPKCIASAKWGDEPAAQSDAPDSAAPRPHDS